MNESFLLICKQNYLEGITPSNEASIYKEGYKKLEAISKEYFLNNMYNQFANYFMEGQYFVSLWAAHMLIEYGSPNKEILASAIKVIKRYTDNPLAPSVAEEEREWIRKNLDKYSRYL